MRTYFTALTARKPSEERKYPGRAVSALPVFFKEGLNDR
jgi:hypothetical protein